MKNKYRHTASTREYERIDSLIVQNHLSQLPVDDLIKQLNDQAHICTSQFAELLELLKYRGFKISHGTEGEITDVYKDEN